VQIRPLADKMFHSSKATMHIYSHTKFELSILITSWRMRGSQKSKIASWCCMLKLLCISIHILNFSLNFQNFNFSTVRMVKRVELHAKFCRNGFNRGRDITIFRYFKMATTAILDCQISLEPRPRYVSFNIMLVWLENAYSRPFWGVFLGHISPKWCHSSS